MARQMVYNVKSAYKYALLIRVNFVVLCFLKLL